MFTHCNRSEDLSPYTSNSSNDVPVVITTVSCSMSLLGACGIFLTFFLMPEIRKFVRVLVVFLTIADFLTAAGYTVSTFRHFVVNDAVMSCQLCIIQSAITTYSSMVSFFLTMIIAVHMFLTVYNRKPVTGTTAYMCLFNAISWLIPGIIIAIAISKNALGPDVTRNVMRNETSQAGHADTTGPWCWIRDDRRSLDSKMPIDVIMWMLITGKGWEIMCYLVTTSLYVLLKLHLVLKYRNHQFQEIHESLRYEDKNYILVFLILWSIRVWGTIRFFISLAHRSSSQTADGALEYLQAFGDPSQAFFNFCLFCLFDRTVRRKMFGCASTSDEDGTRLIGEDNIGGDVHKYGSENNSECIQSDSTNGKPESAEPGMDAPSIRLSGTPSSSSSTSRSSTSRSSTSRSSTSRSSGNRTLRQPLPSVV